MSKRIKDDEIKDYNKEKIYFNDDEDNYDSQDDIDDDIEDEKYCNKIEDDIFQTHKKILEYVVDNNLNICEYMIFEKFQNFLIENKIID